MYVNKKRGVEMKRLFSGAQPTGTLHIGNYLGAIKNWVDLQEKYECVFSIVDYHSLTINYEKEDMKKRIIDLAATYLACGIDPERCKLFIQSWIKEHTELMWILSCVTPMGELNRMTQFKDKSSKNVGNVNLGLYAYPVLQAADIILYKSEFVPVGEDQVQHIELTREIVRKFNARYNTDIFPEPQEILSSSKRILGIDGENKMSKSLNNHIGLDDDDKTIQQKLMQAKTDPARVRKTDPGNPAVCNVFSWHKIFSTENEISECAKGCVDASIGCVQCKKILLSHMKELITPIREKKAQILKDTDYIKDVLVEGAKKCDIIAKNTINEVREVIGVKI